MTKERKTIKVRPYIEQGHYTTVHDALFDVVMPRLSGNEWKILCYILRQTRGWQRVTKEVSLRQIRQETGIGSLTTVQKAVDSLVDKEHIKATRGNDKWEATVYCLNTAFEMEIQRSVPSSGTGAVGSVPESGIDADTVSNTGSVSETVSPIISKGNNHQDKQDSVSPVVLLSSKSATSNTPKTKNRDMVFDAVIKACHIYLPFAPKGLTKRVAEVAELIRKFRPEDLTDEQTKETIVGFGVWWTSKKDKEGKYFDPPSPEVIRTHWGAYIDYCCTRGSIPKERM
jgi:hypothetical protein